MSGGRPPGGAGVSPLVVASGLAPLTVSYESLAVLSQVFAVLSALLRTDGTLPSVFPVHPPNYIFKNPPTEISVQTITRGEATAEGGPADHAVEKTHRTAYKKFLFF